MVPRGAARIFGRGGTLKITINSPQTSPEKLFITISDARYAKAAAPAKLVALSQSVTERSVRRHRRLIHSTTNHFYQRGEYYVYFF